MKYIEIYLEEMSYQLYGLYCEGYISIGMM